MADKKVEFGHVAYAHKNQVPVDYKNTKYLETPGRKTKPEKNYTLAEKFAPNRDKPTTADAQKGLLDLPAAMAAVDPQGLSSIAPMMYQMLGQISAASSGSSQSSRKKTMENALSGALAILSNKYSFDTLTLAFDTALKNNQIRLIDAEYKSVVKNAIANMYSYYKDNPTNQFPTTTYSYVTVKADPAPSPIVTFVPDLYVKQYYTDDANPYPGYIQWVSPDGTTYVYTELQIGDPYYTSAVEEVYTVAEQELAIALDPYVATNTLTVLILNDLLRQQDQSIEQNTQEATGGKNSSSQLTSIITQLAGYLGSITQLQQSIQLPLSVLNQGSIAASQKSFLTNMAQIQKEKALAQMAAQPSSALSSLGSVSGLTGAASSLYNTIKS